MEKTLASARHFPVVGLAAGIAGLGTLSLMAADFGFQWQPIARAFPYREQWAMAVGGAEIVIALALLIPASRMIAAVAASSLYAFWSLLHAPPIVEQPQNIAAWLGSAEPFFIASASLVLALSQLGDSANRLSGICVRAAGAACIIFGASHFAYGEFTAAMVPEWMPERLFLAYLTGAIHAGCGLALLVGFRTFFAASIEAAMMSSFVFLVHIPRVAAQPSNRFEWTMMFVAIVLSSSAWIIAAVFGRKRTS